MFNSELKPLLRYHCLFWSIIFTLSVFSWCLDYLLWDKAEALQYLAMSFVSDAAAMLVTGALLIWSQYKINQHNFAVWHLSAGRFVINLYLCARGKCFLADPDERRQI